MGCMKCGRDLEPGQVFCEECLADMRKYPVKPGTVVTLPRRKEAPPKRAPRKKPLTPEEQIRRLRKQNRRLIAANLALILLLAVLGVFLVREIMEENTYRPGQNYSTMDATEDTDATKDAQED